MSKTESKISNVDAWIKGATKHQLKALETASRQFDDDDFFDVHTLESIYGTESSFGVNRRQRGIEGAAGDFQLEKNTAERMGLHVSKENDERFDVDKASNASAKYLKVLDGLFESEKILYTNLKTIPVTDSKERKIFSIAAFNGGEGTVAKAQILAKQSNLNPEKWNDVKNFLDHAGISNGKANEIREYIEKVVKSEKEFREKSPSKEEKKNLSPASITKNQSKIGHWITKLKRHIFIENK